MLNDLERRAMPKLVPFSRSVSREDSIEDLCEILEFCQNELRATFKKAAATQSFRSLCLLKICIHLRTKDEGLILLEILGANEGIPNDEVAEAIADFECQGSGKKYYFYIF